MEEKKRKKADKRIYMIYYLILVKVKYLTLSVKFEHRPHLPGMFVVVVVDGTSTHLNSANKISCITCQASKQASFSLHVGDFFISFFLDF